MQKEFSAFKTTILLYVAVLMLPFGFYFVNSSFKTIQEDTKIVHDTVWITSAIEKLALDPNSQENQSSIHKIDTTLEKLSYWVTNNSDTNLYIGGHSLQRDFAQVKQCWDNCKHAYLAHEYEKLKDSILSNIDMLDRFSINIEKMVWVRQDKIINIFYITLMIIMILMLLSIYFVRLYIEYQMTKHSVYDLETNLYNHNYFNEHMKTTCARAARYKYPLSLLSISINGIDKKSLDEKEYAKFMETVGDILLTMTRTSDVACRYDEDHIAIILPFTEDKNAEILKGRIQETFEKHNFNISQTPTFVFSIVQYEPQETAKEYIERAEKVLRER